MKYSFVSYIVIYVAQCHSVDICGKLKESTLKLKFSFIHPIDEAEQAVTRETDYEVPTWNRIYNMLLNQAQSIRRAGFKPDVIVGVSRGGWLPARVLSDLLENSNLANVKAESYKKLREARKRFRLTQRVSMNVNGKRVLLVDEVADSGRSLRLLSKHMFDNGALEVKTATLYDKDCCVFRPDYCEAETSAWIVFPWEIKETIRQIVDANKENSANMEREFAKLADSGVSKRLIGQFLKEFSGAKTC